MKFATRHRPTFPDPGISLVNVVFLLLIFVVLAGTVTTAANRELSLPRASTLPLVRLTPDRVIAVVEGGIMFEEKTLAGADLSALVDAYRAQPAPRSFEVFVDRDLPANRLLAVVADLEAAGIGTIDLVTIAEPEE